jgi:ribosome biogenesis protein ERB1
MVKDKQQQHSTKRKREEDVAVAQSSDDDDETTSSSADWGSFKQKSTTQFDDDFSELNLSDDDDEDEQEDETTEDNNDGYTAEEDDELRNHKKNQNGLKKYSHKKQQDRGEVSSDDDDDDDVYVSDEEYGEHATATFSGSDTDEDEDIKVIESYKNELTLQQEKKSKKKQQQQSEQQQEKQQPSIFDDVDLSDDSSEDESMTNTVGNIPLKWYEEYDHIGYDRDGNKILRKKRKDALDNLIARHDDPNYIRTVYDEMNDKEVVLNNRELQLILDVNNNKFVPGFNPYRDYVDYVKVDSRFPLVGIPTTKSSFGPNKEELKVIAKIASKMRKDPSYGKPQEVKRTQEAYLMWGSDGTLIGDAVSRVGLIQSQKILPPGHGGSYNPPPEYVKDNPVYQSLRNVPAYDNFVNEQYQRCLDLYLKPRALPRKKKIDAEKLLPELPKPEELRPYPEIPSIIYEGHNDTVTKLSVDPSGKWLLTGCDDHVVRLFEVKTGRLVRSWVFEDVIHWVEWNPNTQINLFAVAVKNFVYLVQPIETGTEKSNQATKDLFPTTAYQEENQLFTDEGEEQRQESDQTTAEQSGQQSEDADEDVQGEQTITSKSKKGRNQVLLRWRFYREEEDKSMRSQGILMRLEHLNFVTQVTWHFRGDYFTTLSPASMYSGIIIHQLSRRQSQKPFKKKYKAKGVKNVRLLFHPREPILFIATTETVRAYNLKTQRLVKKLKGQRCKRIWDIAVHPNGGHILTGGADSKAEWFDLELSSRPFKTLRYHTLAVKSVAFHPRYPLFATSSDDLSIHVFHCTVPEKDDWLTDPKLVPLKILRGHRKAYSLGVQDIQFHPTQPWLFSCGSDRIARLWIS